MLSLVLMMVGVVRAQVPVEYRILRTPQPITIDARLDEPAWQAAPPVSAFVFNWFAGGEKEPTEAKMLWDDQNLYVSWRATDRHISAYETKRHGPVSKDDCVEIFLSPNPAKVRNYYTFEINAIGTMLNRCRTDWWQGPPTWEPDGVVYRTTYHDQEKKDEAAEDREWIVEMAIPLKNFAKDAAHMPPQDGDEWRLNLQRLGGKTNAQASTWSPIPPPARSFHTPEAFGKVTFVKQDVVPAGSAARGRRGSRGVGAERVAARILDGAEEGRAIYNRSCTMCHGLDGTAGDRAPGLGGQRRYLRRSEADLYDAIKNGIKGTLMPLSPLPEADIRKMVAFIFSLRATAADVAVAGNAANGEQIFHGKGKCSGCHMIRGRGGLLGPDLSDIAGERKLDQLRTALTKPQPVPPTGFKPVTVTMKDGRSLRGVVKNENNFSLQILGEDGRLHLLNREEAKGVEYGERSLMPANFDKALTPAELQDVLAFLSKQARSRK